MASRFFWLLALLFLALALVRPRADDTVQEYAEHDEGDEEELLYGDEEEEGDVATELPGAKHSKPHGQLSLKVRSSRTLH